MPHRLAELPHQRAAVLSAAIGATCELLALALGIVGRRHLPGKIAGVGSGVLIGLTVIGLATWVLR